MKVLKLRFVSHPGIFNWACTFAQNGFGFTHVEIVMEDGTLLGAMGDGVKARPSGYDAGKFSREMFLEVRATDEQAEIFYAFIESQIGKPYDYWAVYAFFWPWRDWQQFDHWDCSELIGTALSECGILLKELAVKFSRLTVLGIYLLVCTRTEAGVDVR